METTQQPRIEIDHEHLTFFCPDGSRVRIDLQRDVLAKESVTDALLYAQLIALQSIRNEMGQLAAAMTQLAEAISQGQQHMRERLDPEKLIDSVVSRARAFGGMTTSPQGAGEVPGQKPRVEVSQPANDAREE